MNAPAHGDGQVPGTVSGHGGELVLAGLEPSGVRELFTLSGAHIFPLYDACVKRGWPIYDVRHEQTATFAAEGLAKLTRRPGVAALTAGPGVTNAVSAVTTAHFNGSPLVVLGGRAAEEGWGRGALQEFDHVPVLTPVTKFAETLKDPDRLARDVAEAVVVARRPHRGPVFLDLPLDVVFAQATDELPEQVEPRSEEPDDHEVRRAAHLLATARCPAVLVGSDVYWAGAEEELRACVEALGLPTFANGLGRGMLPADHELSFSRVRSRLRDADVVAVIGTPLDFRVGFGRFGDAAVIHVVDSLGARAPHEHVELTVAGDLARVLAGIAEHSGDREDHGGWIAELRAAEDAARAADVEVLEADGVPILPTRIYGELRRVLDRDAVVVCDGGDFVSYAGKYLDSHRSGCWLDPGPFGCLGTGMGYAMAARVAHPDRQVAVLLGDGASGFSLMDVDSLVRHGLPVVMVMGNNGIWGLEKHPMQMLYGYDVAADLQSGCRYDAVVSALGGAGEVVERPEDIGPALRRAFDSGVPYLVNILTDPADAYPRSSNLA